MTSSRVAAPISSHQAFTTGRCTWMPWTVSQVRRPGTLSGTSSASTEAPSAMSSASLTPTSSSSASSTNSSLQSSGHTGVIPNCLKDPETKTQPSSVNRTRHRNLSAPCLAALALTILNNASSARGPKFMQSWPTQNSTLAVLLSESRTQTASAEPFSLPMTASRCTACSNSAACCLACPFWDALTALPASGRPRTSRSSFAVASSASFSRMNSSKSTSSPACLSAIHWLKTKRPCTCLNRMGTVATVLLSLAAPVSVK
mmetsp:Transcript_72272/g.215657  ORF Transcript_72272/g.215657 Transcript_72272/m.215657 type:complete len:259 (-) Transcript_72272:704-1480(-)